jgi:hypothetical protein
MKSKYIVFKEKGGIETLIQFEVIVKHSDLSIQFGTPVSAGFITDNRCHGHSESLKLTARPVEDTILLTRLKEGL